ncbi:MAG TPA: glycosyltransferase [Methylomirabilota bacterium]
MSRLRLVVLGLMGALPFAGVAWQVLHYLEGFRRLGHDVWYVEDTGAWPFDVEANAVSGDPRYTVDYLARAMAGAGFADRWAYRAACETGRVYGQPEPALRRVLAGADVLVNLSGATVLGPEHARVPVRIYLETDPVLPQIEVALGRRFTIEHLAAHTHHFTFGENLGAPDCEVPGGVFAYHPTRQPVVLDWWRPSPLATPAANGLLRFTTVANWRQREKDVAWQGRTLGWSKHERFEMVLDLPRRSAQHFELALAAVDDAARARLDAHGWRVVDAVALTREPGPYRDYVWASSAEFTVAKAQNVELRSGWFSDRSACYLAAGKPVVTEDTGFGRVLPTGRGLFAFRSLDDALGAVDAIAADRAAHAAAAREIARAHFAAEQVLGELLARAGV